MVLDKRLLYSAYRIVTVHAGPDGSTKIVHGTCFHINVHNRFFLATNRHNVELSSDHPGGPDQHRSAAAALPFRPTRRRAGGSTGHTATSDFAAVAAKAAKTHDGSAPIRTEMIASSAGALTGPCGPPEMARIPSHEATSSAKAFDKSPNPVGPIVDADQSSMGRPA